ncbi:MAG: thioredoxin domain-containing protein, partial [Planctomycetota bacterium]
MPHKHTNRLAGETSPYLLQHAHNPVDWFPWGDEAFAKAVRDNKPIFLSIGYSTCHWCHVMEHESFEDEAVAAYLNEHFVSIKVDREERPDIDNVYMGVCQAMTGSGGWPLTLVMTPDKRPFFAGTYFPKEDRWGRPGLMNLLGQLQGAWERDKDKVEASSTQIVDHMRSTMPATPGAALAEADLRRGFEQLSERFDKNQGGFGSAPKFPTPHNLSFLLRW